jgi:23S rRNA (uridine2479-2'-O)-methyltransferase
VDCKRLFSKNADYQRFETLKTNRNKRYKNNEFFVEGVRNINGAVRFGWHIRSFLFSREKQLSGWARDLMKTVATDVNYDMPINLLEDLSGKDETSELMAVVEMRQDDAAQLALPSNPVLALFDRPSNKGNLGTVIRSCDALGVDALILTGHAVDPYDPEVIVSSMGSFFKVPVVRVAENTEVDNFIAAMKTRYPGFMTIGTSAHADKRIDEIDMKAPLLFLIGNETDGLSSHFVEGCDVMATIPMDAASSASSLNVACATTVLFYEAMRQRRT